jgi:hypothetical protein
MMRMRRTTQLRGRVKSGMSLLSVGFCGIGIPRLRGGRLVPMINGLDVHATLNGLLTHVFGLVLIVVLGFCSYVRGGDMQAAATLSPVQLREDVDFLFLQLETVHPNIGVNISKARYAKIQKWLREQCGRPLTLQEFYRKAAAVVDSLEEGHTMVHAPLGKTPEEQKRSLRAQLDEMMAVPGTNPNSYELLPSRKACILRYDSCGLPRDRAQYEALFAKMFAEIRQNKIQGLLIDLRRNGGGFSGNSDLLLRYLARTPFRQYEKVSKRWTPQAMAFYDAVGLDYMSYLKESYDTSFLTLDPNGRPVQRDFTVEAKLTDPVAKPLRFTGPMYVLIGRRTYSSAALFASTVRHYGLATLVGEPTLPFVRGKQHYGEPIFVSLPQSQLTVQISTAVFTIMRGDEETSTRIVPDYAAAQKQSDTDKKIDTVEMFALDLLEKQLAK